MLNNTNNITSGVALSGVVSVFWISQTGGHSRSTAYSIFKCPQDYIYRGSK